MVLFSYLQWFFFYSFYDRHVDILHVTCVFQRILICLCCLFLTCIHPRNSSTHSVLGDLHPFKESYHLGFINNLHPSKGILSLSQFLCDFHPVKESYHLGFISDLHLSKGILSLSHFYVIYIQLRNLITQVSSVIYIRLGEFYHLAISM